MSGKPEEEKNIPERGNNRENQKPKSDPGKPSGPLKAGIGRQLLLWVILIAGVFFLASLWQGANSKKVKEVTIGEFQKHLNKKGDIVKIEATGEELRAQLKEGVAEYEEIRLKVPVGYLADNLDKISQNVKDGNLIYKTENRTLLTILINVLPMLILLFLLWYLFHRQMRAVTASAEQFPFAKSRVHYAHLERPSVRFNDVAGVEDAKAEVAEIVDFLRHPDKYRKIGGRIPRGVLLVGHPGTGKTLLAQAIAGEAKVPFFSLTGSDFVELFVGVGASRVRDLFKQARENEPCIIFLDEIDAVGRRRGTGLGGGHDEREQTLNAILSEMDGFKRDQGIIVIAATNRPDVLDPALLRPGRFDREVVVDLPDVKGREAILKVHSRKVKLADDVELSVVARGTPGLSGAELEAVINEAAILTAVRGKDVVGMDELEESRDKVQFGRKRTNRIMTDKDRRVTAFHEAGHAVVAQLNPHVEPLHKVTIIPRGTSLGMTMILPEHDKYGLRKSEVLGQITMSMGGRVAEEMFCSDITSGAQADIEQSTELARHMVCKWGMSEKLGPLSYSGKEEHLFLGRELTRSQEHSEATAELIDSEVKAIVESCYERARKCLTDNKDSLVKIAEALLLYESLEGSEVGDLLAGKAVTKALPSKEAKPLTDEGDDGDKDSKESESSDTSQYEPITESSADSENEPDSKREADSGSESEPGVESQ